jgi:electron transport protein HydN
MNRFVIAEPSKCIGCRTCEVACALSHPVGNGVSQALSPENFRPRLKLVRGLNVTAPVQCRQCENAPCVNSCPTGALVYQMGTVQLVAEHCIGCQTCVVACPFGAMEMADVPVKQAQLGTLSVRKTVSQAHKCDLCIDRKDGPACIPVCPTKALVLIEPTGLETTNSKRREQALAGMGAAEKR